MHCDILDPFKMLSLKCISRVPCFKVIQMLFTLISMIIPLCFMENKGINPSAQSKSPNFFKAPMTLGRWLFFFIPP